MYLSAKGLANTIPTFDNSGLSVDEDDADADPPSFPQVRGFRLGKKDILDDDPLLDFSLGLSLLRARLLEDLRLSSGLSSFLLPFLTGRLGGFLRFRTSLSLLNGYKCMPNIKLLSSILQKCTLNERF
ncbi:hypothetical protein DPMN_136242 [Dreissena polymorpha]|uniref:Uncharacterized protein n=1 Tax=Dreissena polymorpha TaxID=45954 RepID=A0A9D4FZC1_DREPO|nr:hypothetical protein DPMN_136242 [Dreissena polymorpha]